MCVYHFPQVAYGSIEQVALVILRFAGYISCN